MQHIYIISLLSFLLINFQSKAQSDFVLGADLSYANMMEDCGADFREDGNSKDVYRIFADNGINLVRIRLWHNPNWQEALTQPEGVKSQYSNFNDAKKAITRAKQAGMKVMLGFHLSDFWSDPGRQIIPKAWEDVANNEELLSDSVYNYVYKTLESLNNDGLMPEYVKIGNENNSGIMTHKGMKANFEGMTLISDSWSRHAKMFNAAIKAVRDMATASTIKPKISLHVADPAKTIWFYNNIIEHGVSDFDIMGFTYYYSYHKQSPAQVGQIIATMKTQHPEYEPMIVETGYLWDNENIDQLGNIITSSSPAYQPVSPASQKKFMLDLSQAVYNNGGTGVIFWEAAWVSTPCSTAWGKGSSQEHVAFFDHRNQLNYLKSGGGGWPAAFNSGSIITNIKVTFNVDMAGHDVSRGVFIVGEHTNWQFVKMKKTSGDIYSASFELLPGQVYAYYFITSNSWDNFEAYRETVPDECANSDELLNDPDWNTDRAFIVPEKDTIINQTWSSCETFITGESNIYKNEILKVYPNPNSGGYLTIEFNENSNSSSNIQLLNTLGTNCTPLYRTESNKIIINTIGLNKGMYVLLLNTNENTYSQKILIQ
ncbi:MAG TPA: glycosyl hydrolase 53 family protein [Prolixibacteraceae bacterium]|nr:glycosyl hydrolase 53 family protein [Prolixibacteraceae bacterium]